MEELFQGKTVQLRSPATVTSSQFSFLCFCVMPYAVGTRGSAKYSLISLARGSTAWLVLYYSLPCLAT